MIQECLIFYWFCIVIYLLAALQRKLITMIFARSVRIGIDTRNIWWNCGVVPDHHLYLGLFINILALSHTIVLASGGKSWASSTSCLSIFFSWFIYIYACMRKNILSAYLDFVILYCTLVVDYDTTSAIILYLACIFKELALSQMIK